MNYFHNYLLISSLTEFIWMKGIHTIANFHYRNRVYPIIDNEG